MSQGQRDEKGGYSFLVTCEHGGPRVPAAYLALFKGQDSVLRSAQSYDPGSLGLAKKMAKALGAQLVASSVSRLLIDLNRSVGHPRLYSQFTRQAPPSIRQRLLEEEYLPYRDRAEKWIAAAVKRRRRVVHISCHSFTPQLDGRVRKADIGLLYDPARPAEYALCKRWQACLRSRCPELLVRRNYPYAGVSDGFTTYLRQVFADASYAGIELEINQKPILAEQKRWHHLQGVLIATLRDAVTQGT